MGFRHKDAGPTHFHHALPSVAHYGAVGFVVAHGAELRDREFVPDPSFGLIPYEVCSSVSAAMPALTLLWSGRLRTAWK